MKPRDLAELAGRNLREARLRNALTTLGIGVGVASLVAMLSLGVGLQELTSKRLARSGLFDTVFVTSRQDFRGFERPRQRPPVPPEEAPLLDEAARQELQRLPQVVEANPEIRFASEVRFRGVARMTTIAGLPLSARERDVFENMQGNFFSGPEADEAILQVELARELLHDAGAQPAALLGQPIVLRYPERQRIEGQAVGAQARSGSEEAELGLGFSVQPREKSVRVVGLMESSPGFAPGFSRPRVYLPLRTAENLRAVQGGDLRELMRATSANPIYLSVSVRVTSPSHVPAVEDAIRKKGFTTFSLFDEARNLRRFFAILDLFLGIFGSLALAVASLGIINTLVMAILERRREIGILKALGADDRDIRELFFAEAGAMGLAGGTLGVLLGWGIGRIIHFGTTLYLRRQDLPAENIWSVPWWLVAGAVGFAVLVSLAAGIYPAGRAARLNPVEALRYE